MPSPRRRVPLTVLQAWRVACLLLLLLAGCGGGGDGGAGPMPAAPSSNDSVPRIEPYERTAGMAGADLRNRALEPETPSALPARVVLTPLGEPPLDRAPRAVGQPLRIGLARAIAATTDAAALGSWLDWRRRPDGSQVAALTFRSEGAAGLRLALRVDRLPSQAVLRVFGAGGGMQRLPAAEVLAALARDGAGPGAAPPLFWLPPTAGEEATLEIELPADVAPQTLALAVPQLSHLWWTHAALRQATDLVTPTAAGPCEIDASCEAAYAFEARAVARMEYQSGGSAFFCTGTLMADTGVTGTPWFLTANHCVGSQAEASTVVTFWFYRAASCGSGALDPAATQVTGGATLRHASADSDVSFLQLLGRPPVGAVHAGSLVGQPATHVTVGGLHHPGGEALKFSEGTVSAYGSCAGNFCRSDADAAGNYLVLHWSRGATEQGSSGSGVFAGVGGRHYLVGHLFAGTSSCSNTGGADYYGRFDRAYPSLKPWLGTVPGT